MVSGFLKSSSHNLRYVGIDSLARIVRINAKYATEHQLAVIDCLEDPDDTLKKKTLELLYKMTKPSNVEVGAPFSLLWVARSIELMRRSMSTSLCIMRMARSVACRRDSHCIGIAKMLTDRKNMRKC